MTESDLKRESTVPISGDSEPLPLPAEIGGRYRLISRLGGGGMAQVYQALDPQLDRPVAVKLINPKLRSDPEFDARFRREAQIVSQLADPHIVTVHDFGIDHLHGPYLVLELLSGETLRHRLNVQGPLPAPAAIHVGEQMMLALAHAHQRGVIHRDIKPDNVFLLAQSGVRLHVKVLDFGIARMVRGDVPAGSQCHTQPGATLGTPRYMAPEQLAGQPASEQSDLYSAAVVIYEALTGQVPGIIGLRLDELCPSAPMGVNRLLEQCLRDDPAERPVSAMEAYLHLRDMSRSVGRELLVSDTAVSQLTARFRPQEPGPAPRSTRRRWLLAAVGGALALSPLAWALWPRRFARPGEESVAGIRVGAHRDDVVARYRQPDRKLSVDEAFADRGPLTPLVRATDVPLTLAERSASELLTWGQNELVVLLVNSEVRAAVVRPPRAAATGRGLKLGDTAAMLSRAYAEKPSAIDVCGSDADWSAVYRFHELGLAVEVGGAMVTALACYPFHRERNTSS